MDFWFETSMIDVEYVGDIFIYACTNHVESYFIYNCSRTCRLIIDQYDHASRSSSIKLEMPILKSEGSGSKSS